MTTAKEWFAVYTKYKCEKLAHEMLTNKGVESYLPLKKVVRVYTNQKRTREFPLIPSYLFVHIERRDYISILETENVLRFIKFDNTLVAIPEMEMNILKRVAGDIDLDVEVASRRAYQIEDAVEIAVGSMAGVKGKIKDFIGNKQVKVELKNMGFTLYMTVNKNSINPIQQTIKTF